VKAEFIAMRLAALCGIDAAPVSLVRASGKDTDNDLRKRPKCDCLI
jgi:hypothetical protein